MDSRSLGIAPVSFPRRLCEDRKLRSHTEDERSAHWVQRRSNIVFDAVVCEGECVCNPYTPKRRDVTDIYTGPLYVETTKKWPLQHIFI